MQVANRIAAWQSGKKLPYKRRLAYLESTGKQYIDTGISANRYTASGLRYNAKFLTKSTSEQVLVGGGDGSRWGAVVITRVSVDGTARNGVLCLKWGNGSGMNIETYPTNKWYDIDYDVMTGARIVNGVDIGLAKDIGLNGNLKTMGLFAGYDRANDTFARFFIGLCAGCKIYDVDGETLLRSFIPVMDFNDVPCMYDEVSGEFFYNQGTGTFLYGELDGVCVGGYKCIRRFSSRSTRRLRSFRAMRSRNLWKEVA